MAYSTHPRARLLADLRLPPVAHALRPAAAVHRREARQPPTRSASPVYRMKYIGVTIVGALAGLGGAWLAIDVRAYNQDQVAGRGFQGLAAMIFGNWRPAGIAAGAGLFAYRGVADPAPRHRPRSRRCSSWPRSVAGRDPVASSPCEQVPASAAPRRSGRVLALIYYSTTTRSTTRSSSSRPTSSRWSCSRSPRSACVRRRPRASRGARAT